MSFIRTGLREIGLKIRRQKTRMALRHEKRLLQKSEINLGREGCSEAVDFPEVQSEIDALKKLEQEQKEVSVRIEQLEKSIQQIETERAENRRAQEAAIAQLEEAKRPLLQKRNDAKVVSDRCAGELSGVDKRLAENDAIDRDLLKQLEELKAQTPPPADTEKRTSDLAARRAQLPSARDELSRARLGSAEACREAAATLKNMQEKLDAAEKEIARVRSEFETRDRDLLSKSKAKQEAINSARAQHQTVEERKNPAYLNIGRHLAVREIAPPNAPHLLEEVRKHRAGVDRHLAHTQELADISGGIDKQELRKFYFSIVSILFLLAIVLPLVFQSPGKREWLPQETETILSLNTEPFQNAELAKSWRKDAKNDWPNLWNGLLGRASRVPGLNINDDYARVTHAMTTLDAGGKRDFALAEARFDLSQMMNTFANDPSIPKITRNALPIWEKGDLTVGRVGPRTIAVGTRSEVDELIDVRLGLRPDLKIGGQFFDRFQALDQDSAVRLISRDPTQLAQLFRPIFSRELLDACQLFSLSLALENEARCKLLVHAKSPEAARQLEERLQKEPQRWLHFEDSERLLYSKQPSVSRDDDDIEVRFAMSPDSALTFLRRLARLDDLPAPAPQG